MSIADYDHYNEEAAIVWAAENDFDSPLCDMSDEDIKQLVYEQEDDDWPNDFED